MKKILSILILGIFCLSLASGSNLGVFEKDSCVELYQLCESCTFVNLTSIKQPGLQSSSPMEIQIIGEDMTNFGFDFTYQYCNTSRTGDYQYNVCGDKGGVLTCENIDFTITRTGTILTDGESKIYTTIIIMMFLFLGVILFFVFTLPSENVKGEEGEVIGIVKLKYIRIFFIALLYPTIILILNLMNGLAVNFASLTIFEGIVGFLFETMLRIAWIFTVIIIVWIVYNLVKDTNFKKVFETLEDPLKGVWK